METYLTPLEVARSLRVSTMTIYRLIHAGALHAVQIGRSYRIQASELERYLGRREER